MARSAYGELLSLDSVNATYRFADDPRRQWDGVLVIPVTDPDAAYVVGDGNAPFAAQAVFAKIMEYREDGHDWPERVTFAS